jgi:hypothetical protein
MAAIARMPKTSLAQLSMVAILLRATGAGPPQPTASEGLFVQIGRVPEEGDRVHRGRGVGSGLRAHLRGEDSRGRVRDQPEPEAGQPVHLHEPNKSPLEPEIPRPKAIIQRRRASHRRRHPKPQLQLPSHDHRDPALHDLPRQRGCQGGQVGHFRLVSLYEGC